MVGLVGYTDITTGKSDVKEDGKGSELDLAKVQGLFQLFLVAVALSILV